MKKINRAISDVVCVNLHFGNEYELLPNETQKMLVREFISLLNWHRTGHLHVLQPMEWIK
ncbi:CapA family protein [Anaerobacillus sp. HL2]|nr:CapA family protein [Anaerobacillus sp. HL2]